MKDIVIPVEICFNKMVKDIDKIYENIVEQFGDSFLSQNQLDALAIAKYQCHNTGEDTQKAIFDGVGREELYELFLDAHGVNGDFESRTNLEMNIYYDANYQVEGGLTDVVVEPWEAY